MYVTIFLDISFLLFVSLRRETHAHYQ